MRAGKGKTTAGILDVLARYGPCTAFHIAEKMDTDVRKVQTILLRLFKRKLTERKKIQDGEVEIDEGITRPRHVFMNSITDKGMEKLEWLKENKPWEA